MVKQKKKKLYIYKGWCKYKWFMLFELFLGSFTELRVSEGQKGQIPSLAKIISNLPLFGKYLATYHFFQTWVCETRVPKTQFLYWYPLTWNFLIKKLHVELEFEELELLVNKTRAIYTRVMHHRDILMFESAIDVWEFKWQMRIIAGEY